MVSDLFSRGRSTVDIDVVPTGAPRLLHSWGATAHIAVLVVVSDGICELCCRIVCGDVLGMPVFQVPSLPEGKSERSRTQTEHRPLRPAFGGLLGCSGRLETSPGRKNKKL